MKPEIKRSKEIKECISQIVELSIQLTIATMLKELIEIRFPELKKKNSKR